MYGRMLVKMDRRLRAILFGIPVGCVFGWIVMVFFPHQPVAMFLLWLCGSGDYCYNAFFQSFFLLYCGAGIWFLLAMLFAGMVRVEAGNLGWFSGPIIFSFIVSFVYTTSFVPVRSHFNPVSLPMVLGLVIWCAGVFFLSCRLLRSRETKRSKK